jgi:hypothetical protein
MTRSLRCFAGLLALAIVPSVARAECTIRRSLFYTSACTNQVCTYAMETVVCDGEVHWHGHLLGCEGTCPQYAE